MATYFESGAISLGDLTSANQESAVTLIGRLETEILRLQRYPGYTLNIGGVIDEMLSADREFRIPVEVNDRLISEKDLPFLVQCYSHQVLVPLGGFLSVGLGPSGIRVSSGTFNPDQVQEFSYLGREYFMINGTLNRGKDPGRESVRTNHLIGTNAIVVDREMITLDGIDFFSSQCEIADQGFPPAKFIKERVFNPLKNQENYVERVSLPLEIAYAHQQVRAEIYLSLLNKNNERILTTNRLEKVLHPNLRSQTESLREEERFAVYLGELYRCHQLGGLRQFMQDSINSQKYKEAVAGFYEQLILGQLLSNRYSSLNLPTAESCPGLGGQALIRGILNRFKSLDDVFRNLDNIKSDKLRAQEALKLVENAFTSQFLGDKARARELGL